MPRVSNARTKVKDHEQPVNVQTHRAELVAQEEQKSLQVVVEKLGDLQVRTPEDYELAGEQLREIQARKKALEEKQRSILGPLLQAEKRVRALFRPPLELCAKARGLIEGQMTSFRREQERQRREEEERLRALAQKEQEKLKKKAERRAEKLKAKGNEEAAQEALESVPEIAMPVLADPEIPKTAGIKTRKTWRFRIRNENQQAELLKKVVAQYNANKKDDEPELISGEWWFVDEKRLGQFVRATKGQVRIPGVEVYEDEITAVEA